jgi:hypothetical protein
LILVITPQSEKSKLLKLIAKTVQQLKNPSVVKQVLNSKALIDPLLAAITESTYKTKFKCNKFQG